MTGRRAAVGARWPAAVAFVLAVALVFATDANAGTAKGDSSEAQAAPAAVRSASQVSPAGRVSATSSRSAFRLKVRSARVAGSRIAWASIGSGRPLLLLNGTGSPMAEWDPRLLSHLSEDRQVIVFDYPGLGNSGPPAERITFRRLAKWTAGLMRRIHVKKADVLGWSMGGFVAQNMLRHHPGRLRHVILAGTNPGGPNALLGPEWAQQIDSDPDAGLRGYLDTNYPRTVCGRRAGRAAVRRINNAIRTGRYGSDRVPASTYRAMVRAEDPWLRSDANQRALRKVAKPVLVMTGVQDVVTPIENSRLIADVVPGARLVAFEGAGHSFLFQQPALVAREIGTFLAGSGEDTPAATVLPTRCAA